MDPISVWVAQVIRDSQRLIAQIDRASLAAPVEAPAVVLPESLRRRLNWRTDLEA